MGESESTSDGELTKDAKCIQHLAELIGFELAPVDQRADASAAKAFMQEKSYCAKGVLTPGSFLRHPSSTDMSIKMPSMTVVKTFRLLQALFPEEMLTEPEQVEMPIREAQGAANVIAMIRSDTTGPKKQTQLRRRQSTQRSLSDLCGQGWLCQSSWLRLSTSGTRAARLASRRIRFRCAPYESEVVTKTSHQDLLAHLRPGASCADVPLKER